MATEVLRPQDCLIERIRVPPAAYSRRRSFYGNANNSSSNNNYTYSYNNSCSSYANPRSSRRPAVRPERLPEQRRNHGGSVSKRSSSDDLKAAKTMEKVTILRRGESLDSKIKSSSSGEALKKERGGLVVCGTQRLGPAPDMVPKRLGTVDMGLPVVGNADVYAGSAFAVSPAPSSLPLPSFSKKKPKSPAAPVDDSATRDLRRLLRIG